MHNSGSNMEISVPTHDSEAQITTTSSKRGGWITFPSIAATVGGLALTTGGWQANLIVYLIQEFHIKNIYAAQVYNIVNGFTNVFPIVAAILCDSFFGSFPVISTSSFISLLGVVLITLTSSVNSLRPKPCEDGSSSCEKPSSFQFAFLYTGIALGTIGLGGTRFTLGTMGANQFDKLNDRRIFFSWYFFIFYACLVISNTGIVYLQDNVSWELGYALCITANLVGLVSILSGICFYVYDKPNGSPFTALARVVSASIMKRNVPLSSNIEDYEQDPIDEITQPGTMPRKCLRFLNHAALKTEGDLNLDGSIANRWRLCTVKQVEDLKNLIRILPLWSTGILLSTPIAVNLSLTVLQALTMDRHLCSHFKIPAASLLVLVQISASISLPIIDLVLTPTWQRVTRRPLTNLQRIGIGHVVNALGMVVSALVESKRLEIVHSHQVIVPPGSSSIVPMLALWLIPQLVLIGIGEAFHLPGQVSLYYQEFPACLRSTATAMIALNVGVAYYMSTAVIDLVQKATNWLPDNLNKGRLNYVYWMLMVIGVLNFVYFLACSKLYKSQIIEREDTDG